jgi:hypothetical protein
MGVRPGWALALVLLVTVLVVLAGSSAALAGTAGSAGTTTPITIAWNPSHQDDTGPSGWHEYLICGDVTKRAMALLPDYNNVLCWETGMGLGSHNYDALGVEVNEANAAGAQLFIAVHVDAGAPSGVSGDVYAGDAPATAYATALLKGVAADTGLTLRYVHGRTDLYVLDPVNNKAPMHVLLELGDSTNDRAYLESEAGRQAVAEALATAVRENTPPMLRYEQADAHISYTGTWTLSSTSAASGGSFRYAKTSGSGAIVDFTGNHLAWIAKLGPTYGRAKVTLDDGAPAFVDLYSATTVWQQAVWDSGPLDWGAHQLKIEWTGVKSNPSATGTTIDLDALDLTGFIGKPVTPATPGLTRYEQTNSKISYLGNWTTFSSSGASGGSYTYATSGSADIWFTGTRLDWIATTGTTQGNAQVSVDGGDPATVDLHSASTQRQQKVWSTGDLPQGTHEVKIVCLGKASGGGARVNVDAVDVMGALAPAPKAVTFEDADGLLAYTGAWTRTSTGSASGSGFRYAKTAGSSVTVKFTGTYLVWIAKKSAPYGWAAVTLDGGAPVLVDLYSASVLWKQKVWDSGTLAEGTHTVRIEWTGTPSVAGGGVDVNVDAFQIMGTLD